jgi:preprotein translocase subunit SecF
VDWLKNRLDALSIDFLRRRRIFAVVSIVAVLASWLLFFVAPLVTDGAVGPRWGIDFQGGTELHLQFNHDEDGNALSESPEVAISDVRAALEELGLGDDVVQRIGPPAKQEYQIRIKDTTVGSEEDQAEVMGLLAGEYGADRLGEPRVDAEVGTRMIVPFAEGDVPPLDELEKLLGQLEGVTVSESREPGEIQVRMPGVADNILDQLEGSIDAPFIVKATESVGPKVGGDLRTQGFIAIAITLGLVLVYIAFRFDIAFAPGAVLALLHDVSLTAGVFVLLGLEINLPIVGALLTIVGYSLNDTIVIYDRIRENQDRYRRQDLPELINVSINETLTRTVATSVTTFLAITPFLLFGGKLIPELIGMPSAGDVIWSFAFAMMLGIIFGTYSTVYVASPTILVMQDVKPWLARLLPDLGNTGDGDDDGIDDRALTASEQRRRERAEKAARGGER